MPDDSAPATYLSVLTGKLDRLEKRVRARLLMVVERTINARTKRLDFILWWNGYHVTEVHAYPTDAEGNNVSTGLPFGSLFKIDPPNGKPDDANAYANEKPAMADAMAVWLADQWKAVGGWAYPLPVMMTVQEEDRSYDLNKRQWGIDDRTMERRRQSERLAELLRSRMAKLRPGVVEKFQKVTAVPPLPVIKRLCLGLMESGTPFNVSMGPDMHDPKARIPAKPWRQNLLHRAAIPDGQTIPWDEFSQSGVDGDAIIRQELLQLLADAWQEAGGHAYPLTAVFGIHDDGSEYDLTQRRWVTDFLGRPL